LNTSVASTIRLLLLDDHAMFRQGLVRVLEKEPGFTVVGQCASAAAAIAELPGSGATMILLDVDLGAERAIDFIADARKQGFKGQILVVTAGVSEQVAVQLIQAGVAGILHKHHSAEDLCAAIRQVVAGEVYLEKPYMASLFRTVDKTRTPNRPKLTERDKVVLRFIFQGLTNREVSIRLQISESGAKSALRQLFDKLGVRTRAQLVKVALEQYRDQL
jgi:two-component system nitrate/nitrite response regulator NarL